MRFRHWFCTYLFVLSAGFLPAKQNTIDSLQNIVRHSPQDTILVNNLNALTDQLWQTGHYDTALVYAQRSVRLAGKLQFKKGQATAFINTALIYWKLGEYPQALEHVFKALKINESIDNQKGAARALNAIGLIYFSQKNYQGALEKYQASITIREKMKDEQGLAGSLNNIGEVYKAQGELQRAKDYYQKALAMNQKTGNRNWQSININNLALVSLEQARRTKDFDLQKTYYNGALTHYTEAMNIRREIGDRQGIALSGLGLGIVFTETKLYGSAQDYLDSSLAMARSIGYLEGIKEIYLAKMRLDSSRANWQGAFTHHLLYIRYRDSLINEESTRKSVRAEMNFDFEKKEHAATLEQAKKDTQAQEAQHRKNIILIAVLVILAVVLVLSIVILRSLRQNQEKTRIITAQKEMVERQKHLVDEKQREITDSINYAERIQRSFLASDQLLNDHLKEYFVFFKPRDIVSGDFYWAAELRNGQFLLATADSTGHGVPGAIMSILNISSLEKSVEERQLTEPAEILAYTRSQIIERLKKDGSAEGGKDGMDCSLLRFDPKNSTFTYAAAHNPVWIVRNENGLPKLIELAPDKMPVGRHDKDQFPFAQHQVQVFPGDMVYTLTDGMPDQFGGPNGKKFMYKNLKTFLLSIAHLPAGVQKTKLDEAFTQWRGDLEQIDDVCMIGVRI